MNEDEEDNEELLAAMVASRGTSTAPFVDLEALAKGTEPNTPDKEPNKLPNFPEPKKLLSADPNMTRVCLCCVSERVLFSQRSSLMSYVLFMSDAYFSCEVN